MRAHKTDVYYGERFFVDGTTKACVESPTSEGLISGTLDTHGIASMLSIAKLYSARHVEYDAETRSTSFTSPWTGSVYMYKFTFIARSVTLMQHSQYDKWFYFCDYSTPAHVDIKFIAVPIAIHTMGGVLRPVTQPAIAHFSEGVFDTVRSVRRYRSGGVKLRYTFVMWVLEFD